jgi:hypothetical protein
MYICHNHHLCLIIGVRSARGKYNIGPDSALSMYIRTENCVINDVAIEADLVTLINLSLTKSSWSKHMSGWNALKKFENYCNHDLVWPLSLEVIRSFAIYCISNLGLMQSTTKSYLSSMRLAHALQGLECAKFESDKILNMIYAGAKTLTSCNVTTVDKRRAMSLPLLLLMAHRIQKNNWSAYSKQVVWTLAATAFFGSIRMGEMLCNSTQFRPDSVCLTWNDVKFISKDEVLIRIPFSKTNKLRGDYVDIFSFNHFNCCPVASLGHLKVMAEQNNMYQPHLPVFMYKSGVCVTPVNFNKLMKELFTDILDPNVSVLSMHSFRAGIPSAISAFPDRDYVSEVKEWGNWKGDSYLSYTRLPQSKKKCLFNKVCTVLLNSMK